MYYIIVKRVHIHTLHTPLACYPVLTAGSVVFYFFPTTKGAMRHLWGICQYLSISFFFIFFTSFSFLSFLLFLLCGCVWRLFFCLRVYLRVTPLHTTHVFLFSFFLGVDWWRVTFLSFSFVVCLDTWSKERVVKMLMVSWTRSTAAAAAALSTVFLSAFFKWQMLFARPPIRIFFLLLFYILFIFCLFFGVCVCFFISGTAIHRTRDTKSECPLYFSQKLCDGQQPRTFFSFFFFFFFLLAGLFLYMNTRGFPLYIVCFFRDPSKIQS